MKVLISPYTRTLRNGLQHPKDFPYWEYLIKLMLEKGYEPIQIGTGTDPAIFGITDMRKELPLLQIRELIKECDTWISIDSFLPHLNHFYDRKPGVVIFSQSDPQIFGYEENINLLRDRKYVRERQFWMWEQATYDYNAFVSAQEVFDSLVKILEPK